MKVNVLSQNFFGLTQGAAIFIPLKQSLWVKSYNLECVKKSGTFLSCNLQDLWLLGWISQLFYFIFKPKLKYLIYYKK